ncbi:hypothetical protein PHMEG_00018782 [Phytophthora megakarya]|uniref:Uncharacterized protein n=1 Tax=Phytophthora megakarya TaxID=4795 RepID=A0A225VT65_9STRA|nr:hypothetical protein PHMEG_00018782 [Phytophthora megakarya]
MVQREVLHELVERSRERMVQVRAGSSLLHVLHQQQLSGSTSLPLLPPAAPLALTSKRRANIDPTQTIAIKPTDNTRRREALPQLKDITRSSFEQYHNSMATKIYNEESMHLQNRRAALVPKADLLKKLTTVCAAALKEMEKHEDVHAVRESLREKLMRAMVLLRGGCAFANAKSLAPPPLPVYGEIKNAHLAFLQFKSDGIGATKRVHPSAGLQDGNTSTKMPIHFGDQICLLSTSSDLPLAIGPDGRCCPAKDSSVGPHMTFTIVDFRNPARYDEVTATDDFWLRIDPAVLAPRMSDPRYPRSNGFDLDAAVEGGDDLTSLLSDTSYYLGCPGWLDGEQQDLATQVTEEPPRHGLKKRFRIVAMTALTPSKDYYGDDAATREYAIETNEGIMRLARWRFVRYSPRKHEQPIGNTNGKGGVFDKEHDLNDAMVNCSVVYLVLNDFALVYDGVFKRGVGVHMSDTQATSEVLKLRENGNKRKHRRHSSDGGVSTNVVHFSACARWQIRILQRTGGANYLQELELAVAEVMGDFRKEDGARVEWLREKQEKMTSNDRRLQAKARLVADARREYDLVAVRRNNKLEQIERQKGDSTGYFQRRLQELETMEHNYQPHQIMHLKQQQLHRVVELPHL